MLFYNLITELTAPNFILIALFEIFVVAVAVLVFKQKINFKIFLFSIIVAFAFSLMTLAFTRGDYSGELYRERFGWPIQYYGVARSISWDTRPVAVPFAFGFDLLRFLANTFFWMFIPVMGSFYYFSSKKNKKYAIFTFGSLLFFAAITLAFSYANYRTEEGMRNAVLKTAVPITEGTTSPVAMDCKPYQQKFDEYAEKSALPLIENSNSLCHDLNMSSDFSSLAPKWAIGKFLQMDIHRDSNTAIFKGLNSEGKIQVFPDTPGPAFIYRPGSYYKIDMNNICRSFFMMVDNRSPSPIQSTFVLPEEVTCK